MHGRGWGEGIGGRRARIIFSFCSDSSGPVGNNRMQSCELNLVHPALNSIFQTRTLNSIFGFSKINHLEGNTQLFAWTALFSQLNAQSGIRGFWQVPLQNGHTVPDAFRRILNLNFKYFFSNISSEERCLLIVGQMMRRIDHTSLHIPLQHL